MEPKQPRKYDPPLSLSHLTLEEAIKRVAAYKPPRKQSKPKKSSPEQTKRQTTIG